MNFSHCTKEQAVEQAARSGRWDDDLRAHAAACSVCADIALVVRFMQGGLPVGHADCNKYPCMGVAPAIEPAGWPETSLASNRVTGLEAADRPVRIHRRKSFPVAILYTHHAVRLLGRRMTVM